MAEFNLDVKVYPIEEPKGSTVAFASVGIEGIVAIKGVRVMEGDKGLFVSMPQSKDKDGNYHDIAFPINGDLRKEITATVLSEYDAALEEHGQEQRKEVGKQQESYKRRSVTERVREGKQRSAQQSTGQRQYAAKSRSSGLE